MMQTGQSHGVGGSLRRMWCEEGVRGLFRGNSAAVVRVTPYAALHLMAYEHYRRAMVSHVGFERGPTTDMLAGAASGATAVAFTYPLDLVRTRRAGEAAAAAAAAGGGAAGAGAGAGGGGVRQASAAGGGSGGGTAAVASPRRSRHHRGVLRTLWTVGAEGGLVGLYRGVTPTVAGILPYAGMKFFVFETAVQEWRAATNEHTASVPTHVRLLAGASAGLVAQTITYPLDVVRRNMQVESASGLAHLNMAQWAKRIIAEDGVKGLYRGLSVNYIKVIPTTAVGFTVYEELKVRARSPSDRPRRASLRAVAAPIAPARPALTRARPLSLLLPLYLAHVPALARAAPRAQAWMRVKPPQARV